MISNSLTKFSLCKWKMRTMAALSKANQLRLAAKVEGVSLSHWGLYRQSKGVVSITSNIYIQIIDFVKDHNLLVKAKFPSLSPYSFGLLPSYFFLSLGGPLSEISPDREKIYTTCVSIVRPKKDLNESFENSRLHIRIVVSVLDSL